MIEENDEKNYLLNEKHSHQWPLDHAYSPRHTSEYHYIAKNFQQYTTPSLNTITSYGKLTYPSANGQYISNETFPNERKQRHQNFGMLATTYYNLQLNFGIMHVVGSQKTAAEFLSRLELTPNEKVQPKIFRDDILTSPIEMNLQSYDVADEEQLFFLPDEEEESEQEIFALQKLGKTRAQQEKAPKLHHKNHEKNQTILNSAVFTFGAIEETARTPNEQDAHPLLKALKLRILHEECDIHLSNTEPRGRNLLRHEERIIVKAGVLKRKNYREDGTVTHHQVLIRKHFVTELLSTLHGKTNKHPGIPKVIQKCRTQYYHPGLARKNVLR